MKFFRFLIVYILVQSIFFTSVANAAGLGGWSVSNPIAQGASVIVNGTKTVVINGANVLKTSTAKITPTAAQVAKVLARGAAGYALSIAVEQLLGSVDWVLDPANNQIVYTESCTQASNCPEIEYFYCPSNVSSITDKCAPTKESACLKASTWKDYTFSHVSGNSCYGTDNKTGQTTVVTGIRGIKNPAYDPTAEREKKTLPLETVAQQVISNAESGDNKAQVATVAAAEDALANDPATQDNVRQQLDTNAKTNTAEGAEDATGATKPKDPTAPDAGSDFTLKFPVFCGWAPSVCEAAQTVISFPQTLTNWWDRSTKSITDSWTWTKEQYNAVTKSVTDFFKEEPNNDTELDIPEPEIPEIDTELKFGGQCPDDRVAQIPFVLRTIEMKFSYQPVCQVVSDAKPVLIFVGFFIAALIVGGIKQ